MIRWLNKITRSVFTRLLLGILATVFLINLLVFGFFAYIRHQSVSTYERVLLHYVDYLVSDLGSPPSLERAAAIAEKTGFVIRYRGPGEPWSTSDSARALPRHRYRRWYSDDRVSVGFYRGNHMVDIRVPGGDLVFEIPRSENRERHLSRVLAVIMGLLTAVIGAAYLYIRLILRPLRRLKSGVETVAEGNLEHRVPVQGADEFQNLADAFNTMTERIDALLKSKERLLLDVSHELRSPITRMKLALEMLPDDPKKNSLQEDLRDMEVMVQEILDAARMRSAVDRLSFTPASLHDLVQGIVGEYREHSPGVNIAESPDITLSVDIEKIRTVFRNLLENALKYSERADTPVQVFWEEEDGEVRIVFHDHGIGIAPELLEKVFDPFFRADDSRSRTTGGYGLGLSLCRAIVDAHGGRIVLESTPEVETRATVTLPRR